MSKLKKTMVLVMTSVMAVTPLFAGCSSSSGSKETSSSATDHAAASEAAAKNSEQKKIRLEVIGTGSGLPTPDKDIIKQELDKALNIDLNLTLYPSNDDYLNQLNVRIASGNYPDLFLVGSQQMRTFSDQGLLLDLTKYKDKLTNVVNFIGENSLKKGMVNGKIFALAKAPSIPTGTYWIRKDWLDNLGLKAPTTIEELKAVSIAFTEKDPDGNGKKDTFGLTGASRSLGAFVPVFGAFGVTTAGTIYEKNGKVTVSVEDPDFKSALQFIKEFIATGSVDPELLANTGLQYQEKAIKGQAGIVNIGWASLTKDEQVKQIHTVNPKAEWVQLAAPKGPGGQYNGSFDEGSTSARYAIPKSLEKDPERLQRVFDLLNYIADPTSGSLLVQYGVEGKHYTKENGKITMTAQASEVGFSWLYQFLGRPELEYLNVKFAQQADYIKFENDQPRIKALTGFVAHPEGYNGADADRYMEEEIAKFVYGKRPLDEYDQFLNTLKTTMKYQVFLDAAKKQLNDLGFGN